MVFPVVFRKGAEAVIASFDGIDLIQGKGLVKLLGGGTQDSAGIKYRLSKTAFYTSVTSPTVMQNFIEVTVSATSSTKVIDLDFDTDVFNLPATIEGIAVNNIPTQTITSAADQTGEYFCTVVYKRVAVGGAETDLISASSNTVSWTDSTDLVDKYFSFTSDIPATTFKVGEKLRITVEIWAKRIGAGNSNVIIFFSPNNTVITNTWTQNANFTQMMYLVPFKIDL